MDYAFNFQINRPVQTLTGSFRLAEADNLPKFRMMMMMIGLYPFNGLILLNQHNIFKKF